MFRSLSIYSRTALVHLNDNRLLYLGLGVCRGWGRGVTNEIADLPANLGSVDRQHVTLLSIYLYTWKTRRFITKLYDLRNRSLTDARAVLKAEISCVIFL